MDNKSVILPIWLDKIIFDDFEAVYEPRPMEVVYNPDQPYEFIKLYLGTYFPRSFAEVYSILASLMTNDNYKQSLYNLQEINQQGNYGIQLALDFDSQTPVEDAKQKLDEVCLEKGMYTLPKTK